MIQANTCMCITKGRDKSRTCRRSARGDRKKKKEKRNNAEKLGGEEEEGKGLWWLRDASLFSAQSESQLIIHATHHKDQV